MVWPAEQWLGYYISWVHPGCPLVKQCRPPSVELKGVSRWVRVARHISTRLREAPSVRVVPVLCGPTCRLNG